MCAGSSGEQVNECLNGDTRNVTDSESGIIIIIIIIIIIVVVILMGL